MHVVILTLDRPVTRWGTFVGLGPCEQTKPEMKVSSHSPSSSNTYLYRSRIGTYAVGRFWLEQIII